MGGARRAFLTRVPEPLAEEILRGAAESGLNLTDYLANALAVAHGQPPVATPRGQQRELSIGA